MGETIILKDVPRGSKYVFKSFAKEINDNIELKLKKQDQKFGIKAKFFAEFGKNPYIVLEALNNNSKKIIVEKVGDTVIEKASKKAVTSQDIKDKLMETGDSTFVLNEVETYISEGIFLPVSVIKSLRRDALVELENKLVESYRRKAEERYQLPKLSEEKRDIVISAIVSTVSQRKVVEEFGIEKIYNRGFDIAREGTLNEQDLSSNLASNLYQVLENNSQRKVVEEFGIEKIYNRGFDIAREGTLNEQDLSSNLASNLYQVLENKSDKITINWNLNISNRYTVEELGKIKGVETVILSPELSFERIKEIGGTSLKKAILGYSRLKGMYIEIDILGKNREKITNVEGDSFTVVQNRIGNSEIFFEKPLNILNDMKKLPDLFIDEVVLEFTIETPDEVREILQGMRDRNGVYRAYNYERGVY